MAPIRNARVLFSAVPQGFPEPGKTTVYDITQTFDIDAAPLDGGFLVKILVLSIDPYMRGRMRDPAIESYAPPFLIGQPLEGYGIGLVVRSKNKEVKPGQHVYGLLPHVEYSTLSSLEGLRIITKEPSLSWPVYVGAAGMPGQTAFMGWKEYSRAKKDLSDRKHQVIPFNELLTASNARLVIQLAKLDGLKVIASAGSDEKVKFMRSIGADVAFNYKTTQTAEVLAKEGGIDVFWDNVGGETLDQALVAAKIGARFINLPLVFEKSLCINGFVVLRLEEKYLEEFYATIPALLAKGLLKHTEEVSEGLEKVGDVMLALLKGTNKAKPVIKVADE
ncbi:hypothetical protein DXG01_000970 [Tephrocybe rancida]|nr:hypothetical protein DXG01_000970 [Tephrocybe rancida]